MTLASSNTQVGALNHIGLAVVSIEESLRQFYDLFDSPEARILVNEEHGVRGAFIEQGETHIELLEPLRADSVIGRYLDKYGEGIHHMAFTVNDVNAKVSELQALGIAAYPTYDRAARALAKVSAYYRWRAEVDAEE